MLLDHYSDFIRALPSGQLAKEQLLVEELLLDATPSQAMKLYYIPFEYVNESAKVFIIGITPGFTQMQIAFQTARDCLNAGVPLGQIDREAKKQASFAGTMRRNLIDMLDKLELHKALSIQSSGELFEERRDLLHTTSVIRYPVFVNGNNYTGHSPSILKSETLYPYAERICLAELLAVKDALLIPLGKAVAEVIESFAAQGLVARERCLFDFPHPSGANGHRWTQFEANKDKLTRQIVEWFQ
ncbi:hypothetical protein [Paenibacillus sp. YIM B09110]|uniref:hypothetical protein n=1 Tax=Paenibacillus sp. YIM B09110 TaxID=3126102 RepID=UPI00301CBB26